MSLRLSTKELKQLQATLSILVSPLDFPSVSAWRTLLDAMGEGAILLDSHARVIHENAALRHLLAGTPEARTIEAACINAGRLVLNLAVPGGETCRPQEIAGPRAQTISTSHGACQLRTTILSAETVGTGPMALVVLEQSAPQPLSPRELQDQYQLTDREIAVSRLLAEGHKNSQVAQLLGISIHTARRHAERVLSKLGVHSRAAVARKLSPH
jgi:DNA-binding CsgD family transcriptional regulator